VTPVERRLYSRALVAGVLTAALALSGCGRKGPLEPPAAAVKTAVPADADTAKDTGIEKPDRPFILDPLL